MENVYHKWPSALVLKLTHKSIFGVTFCIPWAKFFSHEILIFCNFVPTLLVLWTLVLSNSNLYIDVMFSRDMSFQLSLSVSLDIAATLFLGIKVVLSESLMCCDFLVFNLYYKQSPFSALHIVYFFCCQLVGVLDNKTTFNNFAKEKVNSHIKVVWKPLWYDQSLPKSLTF